MPIYEYRCAACGHEMEALQKISDTPLTTCPVCGADELTKLVSAASFRLKGGGWYETDFKKDNRKRLAGDDTAGKAEKPEDKQKPDAAEKSGGTAEKSSAPVKQGKGSTAGGEGKSSPE